MTAMVAREVGRGESVLLCAQALCIFSCVGIGVVSPAYFSRQLMAETGPAEWGTFLAFFIAFVYSAQRLIHIHTQVNGAKLMGLIMTPLLFLFGAGEEISWGQRLFHYDSPEWMDAFNVQHEMNVHNFVPHLIAAAVGYLLVVAYFALPPFAIRFGRLRSIFDWYSIPLPRPHQSIAFLVFVVPALGLIALGLRKVEELIEWSLSLSLLNATIWPLNIASIGRASKPASSS